MDIYQSQLDQSRLTLDLSGYWYRTVSPRFVAKKSISLLVTFGFPLIQSFSGTELVLTLHSEQEWRYLKTFTYSFSYFRRYKRIEALQLLHLFRRKGESTRLPPIWPWFEFRRLRHMWVEFGVGSLYCSDTGFFLGYSAFSLSLKTNSSKCQFDLERTETFESAPWVNKLQFTIFFTNFFAPFQLRPAV